MTNLINVQAICSVTISGTTIYESGTSLASKYAPINSCGTITNALCLGGNLANTYAPLASPALTGTIDSDTLRVGYLNTNKSLNVYDGANPSWHALRLSANATGGTILVTRNGGAVSALSFANESGEIMRIASNNKVSIGGCTAPAQALDVCGGIVASTNICAVKFLENGTCLANTYLPIIAPAFCSQANLKSGGNDAIQNLAVGYVQGEFWGGNGTSDRGFLRLSAGGGSSLSAKVAIDLQGYSSSGCCYSELIRFLTAGNNVRMTITCGGNIAIGTCPNPSYTLDVCGTIGATSCVCSPVVKGSTCVCSPVVIGSTCIKSPFFSGCTVWVSGFVCAFGDVRAANLSESGIYLVNKYAPLSEPIFCGDIKATASICAGTIVCGTTCVFSPVFSTPNYYISENGGGLAIRNSCGMISLQICPNGGVSFSCGNNININSIGNYACNSAAMSAGLSIGTLYRNGDVLQIVH